MVVMFSPPHYGRLSRSADDSNLTRFYSQLNILFTVPRKAVNERSCECSDPLESLRVIVRMIQRASTTHVMCESTAVPNLSP